MEMRKGCVSQREENSWDDWFEKPDSVLGKNISDKMKDEGIGFIKKSNVEAFKPVNNKLHIIDDADFDDLD